MSYEAYFFIYKLILSSYSLFIKCKSSSNWKKMWYTLDQWFRSDVVMSLRLAAAERRLALCICASLRWPAWVVAWLKHVSCWKKLDNLSNYPWVLQHVNTRQTKLNKRKLFLQSFNYSFSQRKHSFTLKNLHNYVQNYRQK